MKKIFARFLGRLAKILGEEQEITLQIDHKQRIDQESLPQTKGEILVVKAEKFSPKPSKKKEKMVGKKTKDGDIVVHDPRDIRDIMELMEVPIVSLSKNRTVPIIYESPDGKSKVKISCHTEHYVASIYDWDIILFVSSKLQETMNSKSDIPPRTLIIPRHELLKEIHRHDGKKQEKDLKASLARLNTTLIETTVCNEDGRYEAGFGFLDSWGYTDRKDVKEFRITLSEWLYEITCHKGSLLKVHPEYFKLTSGLKRFLYRTARKHVGTQNRSWGFLIETLYKRSGSEQEFKKFKYDLRKIVLENDMPGYFMEWIEEDGKTRICFINKMKILKESTKSTDKKPYVPSFTSSSKQKRIASDFQSKESNKFNNPRALLN